MKTTIYRGSIVIVCLVVIFFKSCTDNDLIVEDNIYEYFPESIQLEGEKILKSEFGLVSLDYISDNLILSTNRDTIFHIYDLDQNYKSGFGRSGSGPGEFANYAYINDVKNHSYGKSMLVFNMVKMLPVEINLRRSIDENELVLISETEIPNEIRGGHTRLFFANESAFVGVFDSRFSDGEDGKRFGFYYDKSKSDLEKFSLTNVSTSPPELMAEMNANNSVGAVSPNGEKYISAMIFHPLIEIVDIERLEIHEYLTDELLDEPLEASGFNIGTWHEYHRDLFVTNDEFYLLYHPTSNDSEENNSEYGQKILVIDFDGKPVKKYSIHARYDLAQIAVDSEKQKIIGLSWNNDSLYEFNL